MELKIEGDAADAGSLPVENVVESKEIPAQIAVTLHPRIMIDETGTGVVAGFGLDVIDAFETPASFRQYVGGFDWESVDAQLVFGKPEKPFEPARRTGSPTVVERGEVTFEIEPGLLDVSPRAMEGLLRRVVESATGTRPPIRAGLSPLNLSGSGRKLIG